MDRDSGHSHQQSGEASPSSPGGSPQHEAPDVNRSAGQNLRQGGRAGTAEPRRRKGQDRRRTGFGDEIDRIVCLSFQGGLPETFPVVHRTNLATLRIEVVDQQPSAHLLCDRAHPGPCLWPGGAEAKANYVSDPEPGMADGPGREGGNRAASRGSDGEV